MVQACVCVCRLPHVVFTIVVMCKHSLLAASTLRQLSVRTYWRAPAVNIDFVALLPRLSLSLSLSLSLCLSPSFLFLCLLYSLSLFLSLTHSYSVSLSLSASIAETVIFLQLENFLPYWQTVNDSLSCCFSTSLSLYLSYSLSLSLSLSLPQL